MLRPPVLVACRVQPDRTLESSAGGRAPQGIRKIAVRTTRLNSKGLCKPLMNEATNASRCSELGILNRSQAKVTKQKTKMACNGDQAFHQVVESTVVASAVVASAVVASAVVAFTVVSSTGVAPDGFAAIAVLPSNRVLTSARNRSTQSPAP